MSVLAVVPARGGSKGLPRKNLAMLAGLPLIVHSLRLAELCPLIGHTVVTTDDPEIAHVARSVGTPVIDRPAALAGDDVAMWPVLRHTLAVLDPDESQFELLVLLDPTSPLRLPEDVDKSISHLRGRPDADGVVSASEPRFNVIWQSVVEEDGLMRHLVPEGSAFVRRQDAPRVLYINGCIYVWRTSFVRNEREHWMNGRTLLYETPQSRALSIDTSGDLELARALLASRLVHLPWLEAPSS